MKFIKGDIVCRKDLDYPEGALLCDGYDDAGQLLAHPLGGGFQLTVPAHQLGFFLRTSLGSLRLGKLLRVGPAACKHSQPS